MFDYLKRIDELCKSRNWSYYELAKQADLAPNTVYNWKSKGSIPTFLMLEKVAVAFEITLEQFFCAFNSNSLSKEEKEVLRKWVLMTELEKVTVFDLMDTFQKLKEKRND